MGCTSFAMFVVCFVLSMMFYCNAQAYRPGLVITSGCPAMAIPATTPIIWPAMPVTTPTTPITTPVTPVTTPVTPVTTPTSNPVTPITTPTTAASPIYEDGYGIEGVQNGGFDSPALNLSQTSPLSGPELPLRAWNVEGGVKYVENGYKYVETLDGGNAVQMGDGGQISQYMALQNGMHYTITFASAPTCASMEDWRLNVSVSNTTRSLLLRPPNCEAWDIFSCAFRADSNQPKLVFLNPVRTAVSDCAPLR